MNTMKRDYEHDFHENLENDNGGDDESFKSVRSAETKSPNDDIGTIGTKETKNVQCLRFVVFLVLFISALSVALLVFFAAANLEQTKFKDAYQSEVLKVFGSITFAMQNMIGSLDMLSTIAVSHARDSKSTWPFVTLPDFPNRASKQLATGDGINIIMSVIVRPEDRLRWEEYALNNSYIIPQALRIMKTDENYFGDANWTYPDVPVVLEMNVTPTPIPYNITRDLNVVWQQYPLSFGNVPPYKWNYYSVAPYVQYEANELQRVIFSPAFMNPDPKDAAAVARAESLSKTFSYMIPPTSNPLEPASNVIYPIIDYLDSISIDTSNLSTKATVVGNLIQTFYWRDLMKNILPIDSNGLIFVFYTACTNTAFTYRIDGPTPVFLGHGDLHETKFDEMKVSASLTEFDNSLNETKYSGLPLNVDSCLPNIAIYPSSVMEQRFLTWSPLYNSIGSCFIFLFASIVFILYDWTVERRQKVVLSTAERTNAVVTSLFPSQVREQILNDANKNSSNIDHNNIDDIDDFVSRFKNNVRQRKNDGTNTLIESSQEVSRPIADLYPETTVLFADIKGFTSWSATRTPTEVFTLLEGLYGEFDSCARARRVFKVETIGDCYVAVVGLPASRKNHAIVMVRFAGDMLTKTNQVVQNLASSLGDDTLDLALRVGLNSGATTAGVLRGERARFQLFGDTVNTASRMESNGMGGRIHCSQSTADQLKIFGKEQWLIKREDLIEAKGKGLMQTYWVKPSSDRSSGYAMSERDEHDVDEMKMSTFEHRVPTLDHIDENCIDSQCGSISSC